MCYHVATPTKGALKEKLGSGVEVGEYPTRFTVSGFDHPELPVTTNDTPSAVQPVVWGLIPAGMPNIQKAHELWNKTLNARCETLFDLPSFRSAAQKRCVVYVAGFFEWQHLGRDKQPFYIYAADGAPLLLGGIWDEWVNTQTGEMVRTCSIITTPANAMMATIHNHGQRMPFVLNTDTIPAWLDTTARKEHLQPLIRPCPDTQLQAHKVDKKAALTDTADAIKPSIVRTLWD